MFWYNDAMYHYRKTRKNYETKVKHDRISDTSCTFCRHSTLEKIIDQNDSMFVVANRVSYDVFEGKGVLEHLLMVPRRHVESLDELTDREKLDAMTMIGQYESNGYSVYARAVGSTTRSVAHQHTHFIKQEASQARIMLYMKKPYTLIKL